MKRLTLDDKGVFRAFNVDPALCRNVGFRYNPGERVHMTRDPAVAAKLAPYADATCRDLLAKTLATIETSKAAMPTADAPTIPVPEGKSYLPFQEVAIQFGLEHPSVGLFDEMGLGKTIEAIGIINADDTIKTALVVTRASLKLNWRNELGAWLTRPLSVGVVNAADQAPLPESDIIVLNYDIAHRYEHALRERSWDAVILDEAHALKNPKTRRTKMIFGGVVKEDITDPDRGFIGTRARRVSPIRGRRNLCLTGTPIPNRTKEIWPLLHWLDPVRWKDFMAFARRYADAKFKVRYGNPNAAKLFKGKKLPKGMVGWDFSGSSRAEELQQILRSTLMVRRLKRDVLKELPPKFRQVIELPANGLGHMLDREQQVVVDQDERILALQVALELAKASEDPEDYRQAVAALQGGVRVRFTEMSKVRHETALAKAPYVVDHIKHIFDEDPDRKVIVFVHHLDVIEQIAHAFPDVSVVVSGSTPAHARQGIVDRFQQDPSVKLFIGAIKAAGVGLTLTAAQHVIFAELDWVPSDLTQAEDRAHRIGQLGSVLVQHIVLERSLDAKMAKTIVDKQAEIEATLDSLAGGEAEQLPLPLAPSTAGVLSRDSLVKAAKTFDMVDALSLREQLEKAIASGQVAHADAKLMDAILHRPMTPRLMALASVLLARYSAGGI